MSSGKPSEQLAASPTICCCFSSGEEQVNALAGSQSPLPQCLLLPEPQPQLCIPICASVLRSVGQRSYSSPPGAVGRKATRAGVSLVCWPLSANRHPPLPAATCPGAGWQGFPLSLECEGAPRASSLVCGGRLYLFPWLLCPFVSLPDSNLN